MRALTDCTCGCALALFGLVVYSATKDTARTPISTPDAPQPVQGAYSQAVSAGGFLYLAGQVGLGPVETADEFKAARRSIEEQTEIACQNVTAVLAAGGCKPKDLVKVTVFLADIGDFTRMNSVCESRRSFGCACHTEPHFGAHLCRTDKKHFVDAGFTPPARSAFAVDALPLGALVEIEALAAIP